MLDESKELSEKDCTFISQLFEPLLQRAKRLGYTDMVVRIVITVHTEYSTVMFPSHTLQDAQIRTDGDFQEKLQIVAAGFWNHASFG